MGMGWLQCHSSAEATPAPAENTPGSQERTSHCTKETGEMFSVQEQLAAWDLLLEIHSKLFPGCLIAQGGLGWGRTAGLGAPCPSSTPRSPSQGKDVGCELQEKLPGPRVCEHSPGVGCRAGEALSPHTGTPGLSWPPSPAGEELPSTSVSSLSGPSTEQRAQQQKKKCKMHLKILFHFPFRQKQKHLNNRGQKQLLQSFQEMGKLKSPVRRTGLRRFSPLSCPVWGTPRAGRAAPPKADSRIPPGCSIPRPSALGIRVPWPLEQQAFTKIWGNSLLPHQYFPSANFLAERLNGIWKSKG